MHSEGIALWSVHRTQFMSLAIILSAVFHIGIVLLLLREPVGVHSTGDKPVSVIQARLVVIHKTPKKAAIEQPVVNHSVQTVDKKPDRPVKKVQKKPAVKTKTKVYNKKTDTTPAKSRQPVERKEEAVNPLHHQSTLPVTVPGQRYLEQLAAQQQQKMATRGARQFLQQQRHPKLLPTTALSHLTEQQKRQIVTDCSSAGKKTLAILSGMTGGTITCEQLPEFNEFIKKRLEAGGATTE